MFIFIHLIQCHYSSLKCLEYNGTLSAIWALYSIIMNLVNNNEQLDIVGRQGALNVTGNRNTIRVRQSQVAITINGNHNRLLIESSQAQLTVNGNHNFIRGVTASLNYGFNGNSNVVETDPQSQHVLLFCNGNSNQYPQVGQPRANQPGRNRQGNGMNQMRGREGGRGGRNVQMQGNMYGYGYPQQVQQVQYNQPNNPNFFPLINQNGRGYGNQGFGGFMGVGNFMEVLQRNVPGMFGGGNVGRNYQFPPQQYGRQFNFGGYEQEVVEDEEVEGGLRKAEMDVLPRSKHVGKDGKCTICLCEVVVGEQETFLMCFHSFHWECISDWLKKSVKCPVCQFDIKAHLRGEE